MTIPATQAAAAGRGIASSLVDEWQAARAALRAIEEAEHPAITDALSRVWTWRDGDLYAHDGMAWPKVFVTNPKIGLPSEHALDNPNYRWCGICRGAA